MSLTGTEQVYPHSHTLASASTRSTGPFPQTCIYDYHPVSHRSQPPTSYPGDQ